MKSMRQRIDTLSHRLLVRVQESNETRAASTNEDYEHLAELAERNGLLPQDVLRNVDGHIEIVVCGSERQYIASSLLSQGPTSEDVPWLDPTTLDQSRPKNGPEGSRETPVLVIGGSKPSHERRGPSA